MVRVTVFLAMLVLLASASAGTVDVVTDNEHAGVSVISRVHSPGRVHRTMRKHATPQTARTAWRATAGHIRTPTGLPPAPAVMRTAPAAQLYSSVAATNPRPARLAAPSRASQPAAPNESSAAPAMRPTTNAAGASSDAPSKNATTSDGDASSIKPIGVSTNAVTISSVLATSGCTNSRRGSFRSVHFFAVSFFGRDRSTAAPAIMPEWRSEDHPEADTAFLIR
jgi:hypothetical protein